MRFLTLSKNNHPADQAGFLGLLFIITFAPLFQGGNRPLPLLILELCALFLAIHIYWRPRFKTQLTTLQFSIVISIFLYPLTQLLILPAIVWTHIPGWDIYLEGLTLAGYEDPGARAISVIPYETEMAWLRLLPPLIVFLLAIGLPTRQLRWLVNWLLGLAVLQALLGLIQYGDGPDSIFRFGNTLMGTSATGTYVNRNHLAGLLEMVLPISLALLAARLGHSQHRQRRRRSLRHHLVRLISQFNHTTLYAASSLALLLGLIFTQARAGVSLAMLGILLSMLVFIRRLGSKAAYGWIGSFAALGLGLALTIGLAPVVQNFTQQDISADQRWTIYSDTLNSIETFFPFGTGMGTFPEVYRHFQTPEIFSFINRAHNDYLEWMSDGGIFIAILILLSFWCFLTQWLSILRKDSDSSFRLLQIGAGIGLLLILLHSLIDFNLHIPANAIYFAFLSAIFLHRPHEKKH